MDGTGYPAGRSAVSRRADWVVRLRHSRRRTELLCGSSCPLMDPAVVLVYSHGLPIASGK